jgi:hypothetical protein
MDPLYFVLGVFFLILVVVDLLWTTLWVEGGAGPLTARLMAWEWKGVRKIEDSHAKLRSLSGPIILISSLFVWILLLWIGWTLVFAGSPFPIIDTIDGGPISWIDRAYFTGYTIFTLGNGDFAPRDGIWQLATTLTTASGMLFVTLIVTYILSVLDAVTQKRAFATGVSGLGMQSDEIIQESWNGETFEGLALPLNTATEQLNRLASNHKAYPLLHYFHTPEAAKAPVRSIAVLDETLLILTYGIPEQDRPSNIIVKNARASVDSYLEILSTAFIEPADRTPPPPDLSAIRQAGVPTLSNQAFRESVDELADRRRALLGLVESDRRQWPQDNDE